MANLVRENYTSFHVVVSTVCLLSLLLSHICFLTATFVLLFCSDCVVVFTCGLCPSITKGLAMETDAKEENVGFTDTGPRRWTKKPTDIFLWVKANHGPIFNLHKCDVKMKNKLRISISLEAVQINTCGT